MDIKKIIDTYLNIIKTSISALTEPPLRRNSSISLQSGSSGRLPAVLSQEFSESSVSVSSVESFALCGTWLICCRDSERWFVSLIPKKRSNKK